MADPLMAGLFPVGNQVQIVPDPTMIGFPASFAFDTNMINPSIERPTFTGSQLGVPPIDEIAGETPSSGADRKVAYGGARATDSPHRQPIFWSVVLVALGVIVVTNSAKLNLRG